MKKYAIPFLLIFLLLGCQNQQNDLQGDAENVYVTIKNAVVEKVSLTENEHDQIKTFKSTYLDNFKNYPSDKELLGSMESLINSYNLLNVALGLKNSDDIQMYQTRLNDSINDLDKQFNK